MSLGTTPSGTGTTDAGSSGSGTQLVTDSPLFTETGLTDLDTQLSNVLFSFPDCGQGWKTFCLIEWTGGALTQFTYTFDDLSPMNPLLSQE